MSGGLLPAAASRMSVGRPAVSLTAVAVTGSVLMAGTSWSAAALPIAWTPTLRPMAMAGYYVGLVLLVSVWFVQGRIQLMRGELMRGEPVAVVVPVRHVLLTAAPFLLAAPFGRDLWAYAAQGHLTGTGQDPYAVGPGSAPGVFADEVSRRWLHSPSPYGPVWLRLGQAAAWSSDGHPTVAALLLRVPACLGLALCCWAIPRLAARLGGNAELAMWLGPANPLIVVLGVGGGHNDLAMMGLALAGMAIACGAVPSIGAGLRALAVGAAVAGCGVMMKSPAVIVVAFIVPAWLYVTHRTGWRDLLLAMATTTSAALGSLAALNAMTGLGFGWTMQIDEDAQWVSWLSLPSAVGLVLKWLGGDQHLRDLDGVIRDCRTVGAVVGLLALVVLWTMAVQRARTGRRRPPTGGLAAALGLGAWLAPSVQPWYFAWGLLIAGLAVHDRRAVCVLAGVPPMFVVMIPPSGAGLENHWSASLIVGGAVLFSALLLRAAPAPSERSAPGMPRSAARTSG